jgi:hypothetical protein
MHYPTINKKKIEAISEGKFYAEYLIDKRYLYLLKKGKYEGNGIYKKENKEV